MGTFTKHCNTTHNTMNYFHFIVSIWEQPCSEDNGTALCIALHMYMCAYVVSILLIRYLHTYRCIFLCPALFGCGGCAMVSDRSCFGVDVGFAVRRGEGSDAEHADPVADSDYREAYE